MLAAMLTGCGNFWEPPGGTTSTGTTATTTTLTPPADSPTEGVAASFTVTVSPSAATGTVTLYDGSAAIGTGTLSSGTASISATFTATGAQSLTAGYGGSSTYAASTSSAVSVTVGAAASSARTQLVTPASALTTSGYGSSPIHGTGTFDASGGTYTAQNGEAVVVEGGSSVTLHDTKLAGTAGAGHGVLLTNSTAHPDLTRVARFTMSGGAIIYRPITYNCPATAPDAACSGGSASAGLNDPATVFAVSNAKGAISLTDVAITNSTATNADNEGTLLIVEAPTGGNGNVNGVTFAAHGTTLTGNVRVDASSSAALSLLQDDAGTGSSLTGAINSGNTGNGNAGNGDAGNGDAGKMVSLALDEASTWTVTGTSHLTTLTGLDVTVLDPTGATVNNPTVNNIDGGGHCVYYSGTVNGASGVLYALSGGGFLAPAGTTGLACH